MPVAAHSRYQAFQLDSCVLEVNVEGKKENMVCFLQSHKHDILGRIENNEGNGKSSDWCTVSGSLVHECIGSIR